MNISAGLDFITLLPDKVALITGAASGQGRAAVDTMVAAAMDRYGRLDVLYNNPAMQMSGRLVDCTEEE